MNPAVTISNSNGNRKHAAAQKSRFATALPALWALYVLTLRQYSHGKRWMVVTALFLIPSAIAVLFRVTAEQWPPLASEFLLVYLLIPQAILPIVALLYASTMVQDEIENQTITYLLIRPLPKFALYVVKLLATITAAVTLTVVFTAVTYVVIYAGATSNVTDVPLRMLKTLAIHSLAVLAYSCLFGLLSLLVKRSLTIGVIYIFIVEGVLANLPFGLRLLTVIYYTRLIAYRSLNFLVATPHETVNLAAEAWQLRIQADPQLLEHPQIVSCVLILLAASLVSTLVAASIFSLREFHVKTPEGS